ncbi:endonuclease/exonuclease/phosphatase family protein [Bacteroidota bacterium]
MIITSLFISAFLLFSSFFQKYNTANPDFGETNSLRIMTFNIRYDNPYDEENSWNFRKDKVLSVIRFYDCDIIGLQEALIHQLEYLADSLKAYKWTGVGRDDGNSGGEFSPIFYKAKRFKLLNTNTFWLSPTPEIPGSKGWDAAITKIVTWAKFEDIKTKDAVFTFNTHFDHLGVDARINSSKILLERINLITNGNYFIITGDFNFTGDSEPYKILTGSDIVKVNDAAKYSVSPVHGPAWTFHGFKENTENPKIDYIFVGKNIIVLKHGVLTDNWSGRYPSDHLPVFSEIILQQIK